MLFCTIQLKAENLFLKDGSIITGKVINETANEVVILDEQNRITSYPHYKVLRTIYTNMKIRKLFIQKRTGEGIVAYIVDEDQDSFIFRKNLNQPEEFSLNRNEVLFMSEKNPSGLKSDGIIGTKYVYLSWLPPYDTVKRYNIYISKNTNNKYEMADYTTGKTIKIKNLLPKTTYYLKVTSVDKDNYESLPSNEISITTKAIVDIKLKDGKVFQAYLISENPDGYTLSFDLDKTENFTVKRSEILFITDRFPNGLRGNAGPDSIDLKWFVPFEPVEKYNIYLKKKGEPYKLAANTNDNSYTFKGLSKNTEYAIKVTGTGKDKTETIQSNELILYTNSNAKVKSKNEETVIDLIKTEKAKVPSGIRIAYMLSIPYTSPVKNIYSDMHGADITYSYFFNNYISVKTGINFAYGVNSAEDTNTFQNSFNFGLNFGFLVFDFIYPYAGVSFKGLWLHEYARTKNFDFGGIGIDGNIGIAFTLAEFFGLYIECTIGWAIALDKVNTDISSMSLKAGMYFRF